MDSDIDKSDARNHEFRMIKMLAGYATIVILSAIAALTARCDDDAQEATRTEYWRGRANGLEARDD